RDRAHVRSGARRRCARREAHRRRRRRERRRARVGHRGGREGPRGVARREVRRLRGARGLGRGAAMRDQRVGARTVRQARAIAHPNIALSKYWGKRAGGGNLPAVPSLSVTLDAMTTRTRVTFDAALGADEVILTVRGAAPDAPGSFPRLAPLRSASLGG